MATNLHILAFFLLDHLIFDVFSLKAILQYIILLIIPCCRCDRWTQGVDESCDFGNDSTSKTPGEKHLKIGLHYYPRRFSPLDGDNFV